MRTSYFLFSVFLFLSCQPNVWFEEAMPPGVEELTALPDLFHGIYLCENDNSRIIVQHDQIVLKKKITYKGSIEEIAASDSCMILGDSLYFTYNNACVPIQYVSANRFKAEVYQRDTLYTLENNIAKYHKGHLFLNIRNASNDWTTWVMSPGVDYMKLELIDLPADVRKIKDVSKKYRTIKSITGAEDKYVLNPTLDEFQTLLQNNISLKCDRIWKLDDNLFQ